MSCIIKRPNGIYHLQYEINGKRYRKTLKTKDKKIAKERAKILEKKFENCDRSVKDKNYSIADILDIYFNAKKDIIKPKTIRNIRSQFANLKFFFGHKKLKDLIAKDIDEFIQSEKKMGKANTTINVTVTKLKTAINYAYNNEFISFLPIKKYPYLKDIPKYPEKIGFYSEDDIQTLKNYFEKNDKEYYQIFCFAIYSGCRASEIANLKMSDINFASKTITIRNIKTEREASNEFRYININANLLEILEKVNKDKNDYVFSIPQRKYAIILKKACNQLNIIYRRFHGLRHTVATFLLAKGVPLRDVMQIMGWTELETAQRYIHFANATAGHLNKLPY